MHRFNLPKGYLSASAINTYLRCGMQFWYRYIEDVVAPPSIAMLGGTAVHTGAEHYFMDILDGCPFRMPAGMVAELAQVSLEESAADKDYVLEGDEKDQAMSEVGLAAKTYIEQAGQYVTPLAVEEELRYTSRCGVEILGYLDLKRKPTEAEESLNRQAATEYDKVQQVIADHKFTGKKMNLGQVKNSLQFQIYVLSTGIYDFEVNNLVRTLKSKILPDKGDAADPVQDKASNLRLLHHRFDGGDFDHIENLIESVATAITAGVFPQCDMTAWNCSENWCGYWHLCRGSGRGSSQIYDMAVNS